MNSDKGVSFIVPGRCYQVYREMQLYGYGDDTFWDVTFEECLEKCDITTTYDCLSIDYRHDVKYCMLSNTNHINVDDTWFDQFPVSKHTSDIHFTPKYIAHVNTQVRIYQMYLDLVTFL